MAAWVERRLGLEKQDGRYVRIHRPKTVSEASEILSEESGIDKDECRRYLSDLLLKSYACKDPKGRSFFAFRLHQFISGAWSAYATLEPRNERYVTLQGQQFKPGDRTRPLFTSLLLPGVRSGILPRLGRDGRRKVSSANRLFSP